MTFKGSVRFNLFLDQVALKPNLSIKSYVDLSVRESRVQDTRKNILSCIVIWIHSSHLTIDNTKQWSDYKCKTVALPTRFNKGIRRHSEYQVTYRDEVQLAVFLDGRKVVDRNLKDQQVPQDGGFTTFKDYFPSDSNGNILQYMQTSGDGRYCAFLTDQTLLDLEQPQQPMS